MISYLLHGVPDHIQGETHPRRTCSTMVMQTMWLWDQTHIQYGKWYLTTPITWNRDYQGTCQGHFSLGLMLRLTLAIWRKPGLNMYIIDMGYMFHSRMNIQIIHHLELKFQHNWGSNRDISADGSRSDPPWFGHYIMGMNPLVNCINQNRKMIKKFSIWLQKISSFLPDIWWAIEMAKLRMAGKNN